MVRHGIGEEVEIKCKLLNGNGMARKYHGNGKEAAMGWESHGNGDGKGMASGGQWKSEGMVAIAVAVVATAVVEVALALV